MYRPSRREFLSAVAAGLASSTGIFGQAATLFRFPHVQNVTRTRATIQWTTRQSGTGVVEYWSDSNETAKVTAETKAYLPDETGMPGAYYRHEAVLTKLEPGAYYRYQVFLESTDM